MKEFVEKLIGRLEELKELHEELIKDGLSVEYHSGCKALSEDAIEIVNELAEKYKGGWIPVSERLPEENGYYLITIKYYHLHNNVTMGCFFDDGEWYKIDKDDKVIAWQPLPEPYKGE